MLIDSTNFAVTARASDGRGPAWWAWEFQNAYALGAIIAHGGDVESADDDLQGGKAVEMCTETLNATRPSSWRKQRASSRTSRKGRKSAKKKRPKRRTTMISMLMTLLVPGILLMMRSSEPLQILWWQSFFNGSTSMKYMHIH